MPLKLPMKPLREISPRDLLMVGLPALALLVGGFWLAAQFIKPAPPDYLVFSSGGAGGSYQVYAERYRQVLAKNGIELRELPSAGSIENLKRLLDESDDTEFALVQSGTANGVNTERLVSLGSLYYEPLWVFYRADANPRAAARASWRWNCSKRTAWMARTARCCRWAGCRLSKP